MLISCLLISSSFCVQAKRTPFDPNSPSSFLTSLIVLTTTFSGSSSSSGTIPTLSFQSQTYIYVLNETISINPSVANVRSCEVTPNLPTGLVINNSTCSITGSVATSQSPATYSVKARNGSYSSESNIVISIYPVYRMYVTSTQFTGNITITAADTNCNSNANKPNSGTYKAMLVGSTRRACITGYCLNGTSAIENFDWVFKPYASYFRTDGTTLIGKTDMSAMFSSITSSSIIRPVSNSTFYYWTGIDTGYTNSSNNCSSWNSSSAGSFGIVGNSGTLSMYSNDVFACNTSNYLLCVEQ